MEKIRVELLGAGNISGVMAETLQQMKEAELYAIASRSLAKAKDFAAEYGVKKVYGSYEELAEDEQVDLVYVATPMSEHYENVKMLLEHGKNVLCEKSFALNEEQAEEMLACKEALENGWTECPDMPHEETLEIMRQMDAVRKQWGVEYPQEK